MNTQEKDKSNFLVTFSDGNDYELNGNDFRKFLEKDLELEWHHSVPDTTLPYYVAFCNNPIAIDWYSSYEHNDELKILDYYTDRKELVYRLRNFYGDELDIPNLIPIPLSESQADKLQKIYKYFDKKGAGYKASTIEGVLDKHQYPIFLQETLNRYISIYNSHKAIDTSNELIKDLKVRINDTQDPHYTKSLQREIDRMQDDITRLMGVTEPLHSVVAKTDTKRQTEIQKKVSWDDGAWTDYDGKAYTTSAKKESDGKKRWLERMQEITFDPVWGHDPARSEGGFSGLVEYEKENYGQLLQNDNEFEQEPPKVNWPDVKVDHLDYQSQIKPPKGKIKFDTDGDEEWGKSILDKLKGIVK